MSATAVFKAELFVDNEKSESDGGSAGREGGDTALCENKSS